MVYAGSGAAVDVEGDAEVLERLLYKLVIPVDNFLDGDALLACPDGHGYTMLVGASYEDYVLVFKPQVSHVYVCRNIYAGQMANVYAAIGVWKSCRNGSSLEFFLFHLKN